ncbi:alpha/beta hydrolase fold domain-containing protein [Mycolicibacterium sp. GCM10028919]|uniref:alpha/beta hydrolase fold domain-containing protein n=1 Tax=Mycolicibacterium sp. GCM10028919 TaxID=3273401 RepID=UPI00361914D0
MSEQSDEFARFVEAQRLRLANPNLDLQLIRDVVDAMHITTREPEGVTYAEQEINGVPALWCIPLDAAPNVALLHSHMGGAIVGSMHSERKAAGHIARAAGMVSLVPNYRLAPEHKFPAQLEDMEASYRWLLDTGYQAHHIASVGVSVGGNLAVNLALRQRNQGRPGPGAVLAVSPWVDPAMSNATLDTHAGSDKFLTRQFLELFRSLWLDDTGVSYDDPRVNLLAADLTGLPPTAVYYGVDELLAGEAQDFTHLARLAGVDAASHSVEHGQHAFVSGAGYVPEADHAITDMGRFLRSALGPRPNETSPTPPRHDPNGEPR